MQQVDLIELMDKEAECAVLGSMMVEKAVVPIV